jgi:sphingosine kinase
MGDTRTVVGLMQQIFGRKTYAMEAAMDVVESDKPELANTYRAEFNKSKDPKAVSDEHGDGQVVDTIPPLSEPVPKNWTVVKDDISVFLTSKVPWLARGMLTHPYSMPNDGLIDMMLIKKGASIGNQLAVFGKVDKGTHVSSEIVSHCPLIEFC